MIHSAQNLWRHSLVVIVEVNISRHIGQVSSDWRSCNAMNGVETAEWRLDSVSGFEEGV